MRDHIYIATHLTTGKWQLPLGSKVEKLNQGQWAGQMNEYEGMVRALIKNGPRGLRRQLRLNLPITRAQYAGLDLLIAPSHNYTEFILWRQGRPPEHNATTFLSKLFADKAVTIVDVGANAGIFSLPIAKSAGEMAKLLLVEPNPEMIARLRTNIAMNRMHDADVAEVAIGDEAGVATLYFSPNQNPGEARLDVSFDTDAGGIEVAVETLPDLLAKRKISEVDLLKVDVEGLEDRVILPALEDPELTIRRVYFEDSHSEHWKENITDVLKAKGYSEEKRFGPNALYLLD